MTLRKTQNNLLFIAFLCLSWAPSALEAAPPDASRRVFLNGQAIDDIRDVALVDMRVELALDGSIRLFNDAYEVKRRPGMRAQIVRRSVTPLPEVVYLVTEVDAQRAPAFAVRVYIGSQLVVTVDGSRARETLDITQWLRAGKNPLRFETIAQHVPGGGDVGARIRTTMGTGGRRGQVFALDRVFAAHTADHQSIGTVLSKIVELGR